MLETLIVAIAVFRLGALSHGRSGSPALRDYSLYGAPRAAGADGRAAAGRGVRQGDLDRVELSVLSGDQPDEDVFVRYIAPGASNKRVLIFSRLAVVLLGCWALYQAIYAPSILEKMLWAYTIYSAALTPVVLAAFYSKRVTAWGAVAAIAAGTVVTLGWDVPGVKAWLPPILAERDAIFPALFASVGAMVAVSLFTPAPEPAQLAKFSD